jgi:hypothetical protein
MSARFAGGAGGKKVCWSASVFSWCVFDVPFSVEIMFCVGGSVMYRLICQMLFPSASLVYSLHFLIFASLISFVYSFAFSFHAFLSISYPVLLYTLRSLLASFLSLPISLFHHLLLCGHSFFSGTAISMALCIAFVSCLTRLSISALVLYVLCAGIGATLPLTCFLNSFQFVLEKLGLGWVSGVSRFMAIIVFIGRWSEPWSCCQSILHLSVFCLAILFPHTRSIAIL